VDIGQRVGRRNHIVRITAVKADAGDQLVFAKDEIAAAARDAVVAMSAVPAQADALPGLEERNLRSNRIHHPGDLVARNARKLDARPLTELRQRIAVTNPAGLHANAHMARTGLRKFLLNEFEGAARGGDLHSTASNRRHGEIPCALDCSGQLKSQEIACCCVKIP